MMMMMTPVSNSYDVNRRRLLLLLAPLICLVIWIGCLPVR